MAAEETNRNDIAVPETGAPEASAPATAGMAPIGKDPAPSYRLTTAEIVFHRSTRSGAAETFIWQDYDHLPDFPRLRRFIAFWRETVGENLYAVTVTHVGDRAEPCWRFGPGSAALH